MSLDSSAPALAVVIGSATRPGRLHRALEDAVGRAPGRRAVGIAVHDLASVPFAPADGRPPEAHGEELARVVTDVASASAVILATPVYRGSLTGVLKNFLDHLPADALHGTPTAIVAMGATDHHYLGVDRHLRDILAFFGALVTPSSVYLTSADFSSGAPGPRAAAELDAAIDVVVELAVRLDDAPPLGPPPLVARPRREGALTACR
jgi:FMN reductase